MGQWDGWRDWVAPEKKAPSRHVAKKQKLGGEVFDSKAELNFAAALDIMRLAGDITGWTHHQERFCLATCGPSRMEQWWYTPDYAATRPDGSKIYFDVKGDLNSTGARRDARRILIMWRVTQTAPLQFVDGKGNMIDMFKRRKKK